MKGSSFENPVLWLRQREMDCFPRKRFVESEMKNILYRNMSPVGRAPNDCLTERCGYGGVFGMDFSPDGSVLGAACEKKCVLFLDPLTRSTIRQVEQVHADCVNSVRFLDSRLFATCSDDNTVKLWDFRLIKERQPVRILFGHSNWVKNIEYMPENGVLLTSGFDNTVLAWEINKYSEAPGEQYTRLFYTPGLIRMCLTKDLSKMIISTQWGYLFVVHNFDLATFAEDLREFKPNVCWLMMKSASMTPPNVREMYLRRFEASRNRAELIVDFPENNDAENVTSITPHPYGWCVLSRNTNTAESAEWTCIHDIQLPPVEELLPDSDFSDCVSPSSGGDAPSTSQDRTSDSDNEQPALDFQARLNNMESGLMTFSLTHRFGVYRDPTMLQSRRAAGASRRRTIRMSSDNYSRPLTRSPSLWAQRDSMRTVSGRQRLAHLGAIYLGNQEDETMDDSDSEQDDTIPKTYRRLTHYIEEANVGRGFIKEQSFSADGRLIASPFGFGIRLLAFDEKCSEYSEVSPLRECEPSIWPASTGRSSRSMAANMQRDEESTPSKAIRERKKNVEDVKPVQLREVGMNVSHTSPVLCAQFSPVHYLLATGCYNGKVAFHQPVL